MRVFLCVLLVTLVGCGAAFSDAADGGDSGTGEAAAEGSSGSSSGGSGSSGGGDAAGDSPGADSGGSSSGSSGSGGDGGDSGKSDSGTAAEAGCSTGSLSCNGQQPTTCTGGGTWQPIGNPCSGTTPACLNGSCVPSVSCTPSSLTCISSTELASCNASGQWVNAQCPAGCGSAPLVDWTECYCESPADCPAAFPYCVSVTAGSTTNFCTACNNCNGCCSATGQCLPGTANNACGPDGITCKDCTADGDTCNGGSSCL